MQDGKELDLGARIVSRRFKAITGQLEQKGRAAHGLMCRVCLEPGAGRVA